MARGGEVRPGGADREHATHTVAGAGRDAPDWGRKFRGDPPYPAARAVGSSRFAEIRPWLFPTRSATRPATTSKLRSRGERSGGPPPASCRAITLFTVFGVVPLSAAAPR